ncbi:MAG: anti-sigma factor [Gammaproteobacteria bacterium]
MRLEQSELQRLLAGRYVLGTMRGRARDRFEVYLRYKPSLRQAVAAWEQRLQPLADALPPEPPAERVWNALKDRLWSSQDVNKASQSDPRSGLSWWHWLAFATVACIGLGLGWQLKQPVAEPPPLHLAVLSAQDGASAYLFCTDHQTGKTVVEVIGTGTAPVAGVDELWLLPAGEEGPKSLGLLPASGRKEIEFPRTLAPMLTAAKGLAVSREPAGGSGGVAPTGPILYTGGMINLWFSEKNTIQSASASQFDSYKKFENGENIGNQAAAKPVSEWESERTRALLALFRP